MPKNIVYCCDGTNNEVTGHSTNVLRLYQMLVRSDAQVCCYDGGVGTLSDPSAITALRRRIGRNLDAAVGLSIRDNFIEAYRWLSLNYQPGDSVYLFGFSRGAYTVRAVAGAIHMLGLARPELADTLSPLVWSVYSDEAKGYSTSQRFGGGARFKRIFSVEPYPRLHFVGVWDTVSAFGWLWDFKTLPYTSNNPSIDHVRHAMALDECRTCFQPNLFHPKDPQQHRSIKQVWFAGVHSDVGGGYDDKDGGLSKIALKWMVREVEANGLQVDPALRDKLLGGDPDYSKPDENAKLNVSMSWGWRPVELLPRHAWNRDKDCMTWYPPNWFRGRKVETPCTVHESVVLRRDGGQAGYSPRNIPAGYAVER